MLTEGLRKVIDLRWHDFVMEEKAEDATNFTSVIAALIYACRKGNLTAIKSALDRLDGKIAQEIDVEYPKFYFRYPNATMAADDPNIIEGEPIPELAAGDVPAPTEVSAGPADIEELEAEELDNDEESLSQTLTRMLGSPKTIVNDILAVSYRVDQMDLSSGNPKVKSVIIAGLMKIVHDGRINAVLEIVERLDGKIAEKVKLLGDDVYVTLYDTIAPAGAQKNKDGIYQVESSNTTDAWAARLSQGQKR